MSKKLHIFFIFSWKQRYLVAYIGILYQITNVCVKSKIVTFATKWTKLNIKYHNKFKTVLTNGNCKLSLGLERKHKHETHTARICLIKFLSAHILRRGKGPVDYQGRERHGWGPVWLLYQSRKSLVRWRWTKNGFTDPKSFRGFRETGLRRHM